MKTTTENRIVKFYELDGEQKLHAITQIVNMGYYENMYGDEAEQRLSEELEQDLKIDEGYIFEVTADDEVIVTARAAW